MKRFLLTFLFLFCVAPSWSAPPNTITKAKQRATLKEPYTILLAIDPSNSSNLIPVLIDATGAIVTSASGPVTTAQGTSGVDADPWNVMIRSGAGAELGLAASPFAISIFDAASNLLGVSANPLFFNLHQVGGTAVSTGSGTVDPGTQRVILASDQDTVDTNVLTLPVIGVVDSNNSTITPLGSGATFTGTGTDLIAGGNMHLVVSVFADQASAIDGLVVQFSQDGTNWDAGNYSHAFTLAANEGWSDQFGPEAQFFRVTLTNGGVAQGALRLETMLKRNISHETLHRIEDIITGDRSAKIVKAIISGKNPSGDYINFGATANGNFKVEIDELSAGLTGGGPEANALLVTIANDSTGLLPTNLSQVGGTATSTSSGTFDAGTQRVVLASDQPVIPISDNGGTITTDTSGNVAHDASDAGNPVKVGGQARTTLPTAVADADRVNAIFDKIGRQVVTKCPRELRVKNNITLTGTSETTLLATGGAGVFRDIYFLSMSNTSATNVRVDIRDATAGSVWQSFLLPGDGGGVVLQPAEFIPQATANNNWTAQLSGAVTDVRLSVVGCEDL